MMYCFVVFQCLLGAIGLLNSILNQIGFGVRGESSRPAVPSSIHSFNATIVWQRETTFYLGLE